MLVSAIFASAYLGLAPLGTVPTPIRLPEYAVVDSVDCAQWEAWLDDGNRVWRANKATTISVDGRLRNVGPGDVRDDGKAADLYVTLEWNCAPEFGAGIWDQ